MGVAATLAGHRATHARVQIPAKGIWYLESALDGEHTIAAGTRVEAKVSDLTLSGTILSGGPQKGRSVFRVVGGAGGWHRELPAFAYANDAGTKVSKVIGDAAAKVGETFSDTSNASAGIGYTRPEGRASEVLALAPDGWYVNEAGVTKLGRRPAATLPAKVTRVEPLDAARHFVELASDSIATILPGVVVDGMSAIDVEHSLTPDGLRSKVWGVANDNGDFRDLAAVRAVFEVLDPQRKFRGVTEYRVVTRTGDRLNLQPVLSSLGMPDLARVKVRPGVAGMKSVVPLGSMVLVAFVNSDRGRPYVCGFEDPDGPGFGSGAEFVARVGDSVSVTLVALPVTGGGGGTVSGTASGSITSGSATVKAVD
jgi:hypothetical protein